MDLAAPCPWGGPSAGPPHTWPWAESTRLPGPSLTVSWRGGARPTCQAPWPPLPGATPATRGGQGHLGPSAGGSGRPLRLPEHLRDQQRSSPVPSWPSAAGMLAVSGADRAGRGGGAALSGPRTFAPDAQPLDPEARTWCREPLWLADGSSQTGCVPAGLADGRAQDGRGFLPPVLSARAESGPCFKRCRERDPLGPGAVSSQPGRSGNTARWTAAAPLPCEARTAVTGRAERASADRLLVSLGSCGHPSVRTDDAEAR